MCSSNERCSDLLKSVGIICALCMLSARDAFTRAMNEWQLNGMRGRDGLTNDLTTGCFTWVAMPPRTYGE